MQLRVFRCVGVGAVRPIDNTRVLGLWDGDALGGGLSKGS